MLIVLIHPLWLHRKINLNVSQFIFPDGEHEDKRQLKWQYCKEDLAIPFSGVPFEHVSRTTKECCFGPNYKQKESNSSSNDTVSECLN